MGSAVDGREANKFAQEAKELHGLIRPTFDMLLQVETQLTLVGSRKPGLVAQTGQANAHRAGMAYVSAVWGRILMGVESTHHAECMRTKSVTRLEPRVATKANGVNTDVIVRLFPEVIRSLAEGAGQPPPHLYAYLRQESAMAGTESPTSGAPPVISKPMNTGTCAKKFGVDSRELLAHLERIEVPHLVISRQRICDLMRLGVGLEVQNGGAAFVLPKDGPRRCRR
jgi:hypothetical protein